MISCGAECPRVSWYFLNYQCRRLYPPAPLTLYNEKISQREKQKGCKERKSFISAEKREDRPLEIKCDFYMYDVYSSREYIKSASRIYVSIYLFHALIAPTIRFCLLYFYFALAIYPHENLPFVSFFFYFLPLSCFSELFGLSRTSEDRGKKCHQSLLLCYIKKDLSICELTWFRIHTGNISLSLLPPLIFLFFTSFAPQLFSPAKIYKSTSICF